MVNPIYVVDIVIFCDEIVIHCSIFIIRWGLGVICCAYNNYPEMYLTLKTRGYADVD